MVARLLKVQFTSNEGMRNEAQIHECESDMKWDRPLHQALLAQCCLRRVCGFFNVPQIFLLHVQGLVRRGLYEKTRKSNRLQMLLQRQHVQLFKDPECWSGRGLNLRLPTAHTGAYPIELTGRRVENKDSSSKFTFYYFGSQICHREEMAIR